MDGKMTGLKSTHNGVIRFIAKHQEAICYVGLGILWLSGAVMYAVAIQ